MKILKRLFSYVIPHWPLAVITALSMFCLMGLELLPPLILRSVIDKAIPNGDMSLLMLLVGGYVLVAILRGVFNYGQWYSGELLGQRVTRQLRIDLHDRLQHLHIEYFRRQKTGELMSRITGDVEHVQHVMSWGGMLFISNLLMFTSAVVMLFVMDWQLALYSLAAFPLLVLLVIRYDKTIRPIWKQVREEMAKLTTVLQENVSGVRTVKAFARENYEVTKFNRRNRSFLQKNVTRARIESNTMPLIDFISGLSIILLLYFGGRRVITGVTSLGTLIAFQGYLWNMIWPVRMLGWLVNMLEQALAAAPRIFEILDTPVEIRDAPHAITAPRFKGHVVFDNVSFRYSDSDAEVLNNINFTVEPGQVVAIVGGTGSGKSTLVSLLPRFFDPTSGRILIDGRDIREYTLDSLRRQIGIVLQDTFLFSATIAENISYGCPEATQEDIEKAAKLAQAHDFVVSLEDGYQTRVGERGIGLSGGQKQRIALARALLIDPAILILDEATSSVDTHTEFLIQEGLSEVMQGRTSFIIAKRLSTIKQADLVIVLENGRIVESGTPAELLNANGYFSRMLSLQLDDPNFVQSSAESAAAREVNTLG